MVDDDNIVGREVDIELETVRASGHADVECRNRVLGRGRIRRGARKPADGRRRKGSGSGLTGVQHH